jgi:CRP/FNR family transcriptional regulator, cyclic AMP receptor protein
MHQDLFGPRLMRCSASRAVMDLPFVIDALGKSALFGPLPRNERAAIATRMRPIDFEADQVVFSRGDAGRQIYLVLAGRIRLSVLTTDGRELAFAHAGPSDIFGEIAALDGGERTADATAISRVQAAVLPQQTLLEFIESNPRLAAATISFLCFRLRETDLRLEAIALHRIEVRLARLFLSVLHSVSPAVAGSTIPLALGVSQNELSLLIGASRSKTNKGLKFLEDMHAIRREGAKLRCDTRILQNIAGND